MKVEDFPDTVAGAFELFLTQQPPEIKDNPYTLAAMKRVFYIGIAAHHYMMVAASRLSREESGERLAVIRQEIAEFERMGMH